jgi:hypothetical protein
LFIFPWIGIFERSWDTGDSICICFFTSIVTIGIAQLVECWLDNLQITSSYPDKDF